MCFFFPQTFRFIFALCVDKAASQTCVPAVSAARPGELRVEREEKIEESPGQYDDVVDTGVKNHYLAAVAYPCNE